MEPELPSSSQFIRVVDGEEEVTHPSLTEQFHNFSSSTYGRTPLSALKKQTNPLQEKQKDPNRSLGLDRKESSDLDLDAELLVDESKRMTQQNANNDSIIDENRLILDMQDKELEAVIASIAEVCELNVTLMRDVREAKYYNSELAETARKQRVDHLSYETGAMMLESENNDLKRDIKQLHGEPQSKKEADTIGDFLSKDSLEYQLEKVRTEIHIEEEISKHLEHNLMSTRNKCAYLRNCNVSSSEDGEPCFERKDIHAYPRDADNILKNLNLTQEYDPVPNSNTYSKLSPIAESISIPATPSPEITPITPQQSIILESRPSTCDYFTPFFGYAHNVDSYEDIDIIRNPETSIDAADSQKSIDFSQTLS